MSSSIVGSSPCPPKVGGYVVGELGIDCEQVCHIPFAPSIANNVELVDSLGLSLLLASAGVDRGGVQ